MMSALGGGRGSPKADDSTDKLRECDSDKGGGGGGFKKSKKFADVICTCPLSRIHSNNSYSEYSRCKCEADMPSCSCIFPSCAS